MRGLSLQKKLTIAFTATALGFGTALVIAFYTIYETNDAHDYLHNEINSLNHYEAEMATSHITQSSHLRSYLMTGDNEHIQEVEDAQSDIQTAIQNAQNLNTANEAEALLLDIEDLNEQYWLAMESALAEDRDRALGLANAAVFPLDNEMNELLDEFQSWLDTYAAEEQAAIETQVSRGQTTALIVAAVTFLAALTTGIVTARRTTAPLRRLATAASDIAGGNLNVTITQHHSRDEIGELRDAFAQMTDNMKQMVDDIQTSTSHVATTSEVLAERAYETTEASTQISASVQDIAEGAEIQNERLQDAAKTTETFTNGMNETTEKMADVQAATASASHTAGHGRSVIQAAVEQMQTIQDRTKNIEHTIDNLGNKSQEIEEIITQITTIAEQTSLLALNASIEAARAGEHGKGFAVVAGEVQKLADQSNHSAEDVTRLAQEIQAGVKHSKAAMNDGHEAVGTGIQHVENAGGEFEQLSSTVYQINDQASSVERYIQQMSNRCTPLQEAIQETAAIASKTAATAQNAAAATEEQNAAMDQVASAVETLTSTANDLQKNTQQLDTETSDDTENTETPAEVAKQAYTHKQAS
ncbi:methyl-accepting chemotaxis protein [Salsuginibacillus halophilus]|uniref:Methyl-accepting chemotaxis protein n=2 Tax=Salsuginibacillus halophilus TaxID=517424 RepID=A0A2P8HLB3_9BACI|nr:methyl-accepting chemotaxis protein [Salsuginibacillus halophilus]